jgi:hypothetical protein
MESTVGERVWDRGVVVSRTTTMPVPPSGSVSADGLLVIGGRQRHAQSMRELDEKWYGYGEGVIASLTPAAATVVHTHVSGLDVRGPDDPVLFKCATKVDDLLYCTTETEVVIYRLPTFEVVHQISHPWFNDVHHVVPTADDTILVASSGINSVLELTLDGRLLNQYPVDDDRALRFTDEDADLRFGVDLKPHTLHPNHLFMVGDEPWATRFEARDAVSLEDPSRRIAIDRQRVHDGHVIDGQVWFTTVDGAVVVGDPDTGAIVAEYDLNERRPDVIAGWCRGLLVHSDYFWVGFSRIRQTAVRSRLGWIRTGLSTSMSTRIERYSRTTLELEATIELEALNVNAVFTIVDGG